MAQSSFFHYHIAYKTATMQQFQIVPTPSYGWTADPFLVEYEGTIYLFAEIFLYKTERNGKIGYCKYEHGKFSDWTITMDRHWHLSYPNVFVKNNRLFMVPESYQLGEVVLYELVEFPNRWRKVRSLLTDVEYCDSTFLQWGKHTYMFTFKREEPSPKGEGLLYRMDDQGDFQFLNMISDQLAGARCGGKFLRKDGCLIRVAQNCEREYGGGLIFYEVESIEPIYCEREIARWDVSKLRSTWQSKYCGIHTYNRCQGFEVIDLRRESSSLSEEIASRRVKKVFLSKYR